MKDRILVDSEAREFSKAFFGLFCFLVKSNIVKYSFLLYLFIRSGLITSCGGIQRNTEESPPSEFPLKISGSLTLSSMRSEAALRSISSDLNLSKHYIILGKI